MGHMEPSFDHMLQTSINSLTAQNMIDEHIQHDTCTPPLYTLLGDVRKPLNQLLETFKLHFAKDETSIRDNSSHSFEQSHMEIHVAHAKS